jgi:polyvinyl alcohol dehydrogenase (cytochrome)
VTPAPHLALLKSRTVRLLVGGALVTAGAAVVPSFGATAIGCSPTWTGAGGDWPAMGGNNAQTNVQAAEHTISASNVANLKQIWAMVPVKSTGQSSPSVSGSCVYFADSGYTYALDAATGALVWRSADKLPYKGDPGFASNPYQPYGVTVDPSGGPVDSTTGLPHGLVHVDSDNNNAPRAQAYDAQTGDLVWTGSGIQFGYVATELASPKVGDGVSVLFTTGPDYDPHARPGYALYDSQTGKLLAAHQTTPKGLTDQGYAGAGVWATPAIDAANGYVYDGTSNDYVKTKESPYDTAILKIDIAQYRDANGNVATAATGSPNPDFGMIVGLYKGTWDGINPTGAPTPYPEQEPVCQAIGPSLPNGNYDYAPCGQQDADFAAGPTLYTDASGKQFLLELQKDGTLHDVNTATMKANWTKLIGVNNNAEGTGGNASEVAYDGKYIYIVANPGVLYALSPADGSIVWAQPGAENTGSYRPVVAANGVVYTAGAGSNSITAYDASSGSKIASFSPTLGTKTCSMGSTDGFAIAHNMIFVNCGNFIAAYGLGSGQGGLGVSTHKGGGR